MLFTRRVGRLYRYAAQFSSGQRYCMTFFLLGLSSTAWLYFVYFPLKATINRYQAEMDDNLRKQNCIDASKYECDQLTRQVERLAQEFCANNSLEDCVQSRIEYLFDLIHQQKLSFSSCTLGRVQKKKWYVKVPLTMQMRGTLNQITYFFKSVAQSRRMIQCKESSISQESENFYTVVAVLELIVLKK